MRIPGCGWVSSPLLGGGLSRADDLIRFVAEHPNLPSYWRDEPLGAPHHEGFSGSEDPQALLEGRPGGCHLATGMERRGVNRCHRCSIALQTLLVLDRGVAMAHTVHQLPREGP